MPHQPGQPERHQLLRGRAGIWETGTARTFLQGSGYFMQKPRDFTLPAQGGPRGPSAVVSQHCRVNSGSTKISTGSLKTAPFPGISVKMTQEIHRAEKPRGKPARDCPDPLATHCLKKSISHPLFPRRDLRVTVASQDCGILNKKELKSILKAFILFVATESFVLLPSIPHRGASLLFNIHQAALGTICENFQSAAVLEALPRQTSQ